MGPWNVRPATLDDLEIIAEYNQRLAAETEDAILNPALLLAGVRALLNDAAKGRYFVADVGGQVIGQTMITYEWSDWRNGMIWWFQSVYVAAQWRGRGVFRSLFETVLKAGEEAGVVGFRLYAMQDNIPALETYRRLGMQPTHYIVLERLAKEDREL